MLIRKRETTEAPESSRLVASSPAVKRARRSLLGLLIIVLALVGVIAIGVVRGEATLTPKLALDLQGGTQIILAPQQTDGAAVTGEQLQQAVSIIRQRVDASGVSEAEIATQGTQNISVSIPGKADDATLQRIEASAKLDFRPVLAVAMGVPTTEQPSEEATDESADGDVEAQEGLTTTLEGEEEDPIAAPVDPDPLPDTAYDQAWLTEGLLADFAAYDCQAEMATDLSAAPTDRPLITCDQNGIEKYILGPVELGGEVIDDATAQMETTQTGATTGQWAVQMTLDDEGTKVFGEISTRMYGAAEPFNRFSFVLDGRVLSAPSMNGQILDGRPSITGGFTEDSAKALADQLKFGALPIGFTVQSQEDISATLGSNQLQAGLLAGLIGLVLVVVYSLFQYRALGSLTIASLVVAGLITYLMLTLLSWRQGYRLSLAGVAGIIVAVGITADSFIVYFERIRDALRDGFNLERAVENGWKQAIRTILASDAINFLAAAILFVLAVGSVRGFAFTLGLTTLVDILVVTLFTHPVMSLLARTKFFGGGHPASGLDPERLGAVYRGRAQFRAPVVVSKSSAKKSKNAVKEAQRRQTIAERKAAEAAGDSGSTPEEAAVGTGKES